jgi:UDP-glucose 4-epimerase
MARIGVTGATGFVGSSLSPFLKSLGHEVIALRRGFEGKPFRNLDVVVHLAAPAEREATAEQCQKINIWTADLLERCTNVKQFIFVSSIAAQADTVSDRVLTEADAPVPTSFYGRGKLEAEKIVADSGVPFTILRPVAISGPNAKGNLGLLRKIAKLPLPLPLGGLRAKRSTVSIENFNLAVQAVLMNDDAFGKTFIVANPQPQTIGEIVAGHRVEAGRSPGIFYFPPPLLQLPFKAIGRLGMWERLNGQLIADPTKLLSIGWKPKPQLANQPVKAVPEHRDEVAPAADRR